MPTFRGGDKGNCIVHCKQFIHWSLIVRANGPTLRVASYHRDGHRIQFITDIEINEAIVSIDSALFHGTDDEDHSVILLFLVTAKHLSYCWISIKNPTAAVKLTSLKETNSQHVRVLWVEAMRRLLYYSGSGLFWTTPLNEAYVEIDATFTTLTITSDTGNPNKLGLQFQKNRIIHLQELSEHQPHLHLIEQSGVAGDDQVSYAYLSNDSKPTMRILWSMVLGRKYIVEHTIVSEQQVDALNNTKHSEVLSLIYSRHVLTICNEHGVMARADFSVLPVISAFTVIQCIRSSAVDEIQLILLLSCIDGSYLQVMLSLLYSNSDDTVTHLTIKQRLSRQLGPVSRLQVSLPHCEHLNLLNTVKESLSGRPILVLGVHHSYGVQILTDTIYAHLTPAWLSHTCESIIDTRWMNEKLMAMIHDEQSSIISYTSSLKHNSCSLCRWEQQLIIYQEDEFMIDITDAVDLKVLFVNNMRQYVVFTSRIAHQSALFEFKDILKSISASPSFRFIEESTTIKIIDVTTAIIQVTANILFVFKPSSTASSNLPSVRYDIQHFGVNTVSVEDAGALCDERFVLLTAPKKELLMLHVQEHSNNRLEVILLGIVRIDEAFFSITAFETYYNSEASSVTTFTSIHCNERNVNKLVTMTWNESDLVQGRASKMMHRTETIIPESIGNSFSRSHNESGLSNEIQFLLPCSLYQSHADIKQLDTIVAITSNGVVFVYTKDADDQQLLLKKTFHLQRAVTNATVFYTDVDRAGFAIECIHKEKLLLTLQLMKDDSFQIHVQQLRIDTDSDEVETLQIRSIHKYEVQQPLRVWWINREVDSKQQQQQVMKLCIGWTLPNRDTSFVVTKQLNYRSKAVASMDISSDGKYFLLLLEDDSSRSTAGVRLISHGSIAVYNAVNFICVWEKKVKTEPNNPLIGACMLHDRDENYREDVLMQIGLLHVLLKNDSSANAGCITVSVFALIRNSSTGERSSTAAAYSVRMLGHTTLPCNVGSFLSRRQPGYAAIGEPHDAESDLNATVTNVNNTTPVATEDTAAPTNVEGNNNTEVNDAAAQEAIDTATMRELLQQARAIKSHSIFSYGNVGTGLVVLTPHEHDLCLLHWHTVVMDTKVLKWDVIERVSVTDDKQPVVAMKTDNQRFVFVSILQRGVHVFYVTGDEVSPYAKTMTDGVNHLELIHRYAFPDSLLTDFIITHWHDDETNDDSLAIICRDRSPSSTIHFHLLKLYVPCAFSESTGALQRADTEPLLRCIIQDHQVEGKILDVHPAFIAQIQSGRSLPDAATSFRILYRNGRMVTALSDAPQQTENIISS